MGKINVQSIVAEMQKLYAKDKKVQAIITTGDSVKASYSIEDVIPLPDSSPLKILLGLPGIPFNKIIEVAGPKDTGKSTLGMQALIEAQKAGVQVVYWDSEDKLDTNRIKKAGGNPSNILLAKTNETLKGGELVRKYIIAIKEQDPTAKILVVWDSLGGSQSRSHAERELDNEKHAQPGQDAKEVVSFFKTLVALINKYPDSIAVYVSNQVYDKIGFMQHGKASSGGPKKDHYFSFSLMLRSIKVLTKTSKGVITKYGIVSRATVTKNHLSQSETSVHQMDFEVTALGAKATNNLEEPEDADA